MSHAVCPQGYRIVTERNKWSPKLNLKQRQLSRIERVSIANRFNPGKFYQKYMAHYVREDGTEGETLIGTRVSKIVETLSKGKILIDWTAQQALNWALGEPVLTIATDAGRVEMREMYIKLDGLRKKHGGRLSIDTSQSLVQPWRVYSEMELLELHRQAFESRNHSRDRAGELGTLAHAHIERWLRHQGLQDRDDSGKISMERVTWMDSAGEVWTVEIAEEPIEVQHALAAFFEWWKRQNLTVLELEVYLCDLERGFAGQVDCVCQDQDGNVVMLDWKTSGGVYSSYLLQVALYAHLWELSGRKAVDRAYICRLDKKTAACQIVPCWDVAQDAAQWQADTSAAMQCLALLRWDKDRGKYLDKFKAVEEKFETKKAAKSANSKAELDELLDCGAPF